MFANLQSQFKQAVLIALIIVFLPLVSAAEMTVGGEFEFTRSNMPEVNRIGLKGYEKDMAKAFVQALRERCAELGCREKNVRGKWAWIEKRFLFDDGFWIQVSYDPRVVEILTEPMTLSRARKLQSQLQAAIFETAKLAGLETSADRAGHFNFGVLSAFEGNTDLFLRFVLDFENHPELASGILRSLNLLSAPPLAALADDQREALYEISKSDVSKMSIQKLAERLLETVYFKSHHPAMPFKTAIHNQALGLKKVPAAKPGRDTAMEVRANRSQESFEEFLLIAELVQARIAYLKKLDPEQARFYSRTNKIKFTPQELVDRFYEYVTETGLSWARYGALLPAELRVLEASQITKLANGSSAQVLRAISRHGTRCEGAFH